MIWTIIFRTVLFYFLVVIAYKIMGKREVGELGVFDFIISMLITKVQQIAGLLYFHFRHFLQNFETNLHCLYFLTSM